MSRARCSPVALAAAAHEDRALRRGRVRLDDALGLVDGRLTTPRTRWSNGWAPLRYFSRRTHRRRRCGPEALDAEIESARWRAPVRSDDGYASAYDRIGVGYRQVRRTDPVLARLETGEWQRRYASLLARAELDVGLRLIAASCKE